MENVQLIFRVVIDEGEKSKRKKKNNDEEEEQTTRKPNYKTFGEDYATSDEDEGIVSFCQLIYRTLN